MTSRRALKFAPQEKRAPEQTSQNQILAKLPAAELEQVMSHAQQWGGCCDRSYSSKARKSGTYTFR